MQAGKSVAWRRGAHVRDRWTMTTARYSSARVRRNTERTRILRLSGCGKLHYTTLLLLRSVKLLLLDHHSVTQRFLDNTDQSGLRFGAWSAATYMRVHLLLLPAVLQVEARPDKQAHRESIHD